MNSGMPSGARNTQSDLQESGSSESLSACADRAKDWRREGGVPDDHRDADHVDGDIDLVRMIRSIERKLERSSIPQCQQQSNLTPLRLATKHTCLSTSNTADIACRSESGVDVGLQQLGRGGDI